MKVKIPLVLLLLIATAVGYALGTENGRAQRDAMLTKMGRKDAIDPVGAAESAAETVADAAADAVDAATDAVESV